MQTVTYSYDPLARLSESGIDGVLSSSYTYESPDEDRTTSLVKTVNNSGLGEIGYTYDAVGNITQITKDGAVQESYTYDSLNQLKTVTRGGVTTEYSYQNGNITSVTQNGETVKTYGYTDSTWSDLLTSFNGQTITYDEIGNPLQYRDGMSFTWDKGRQLQSVTKNGVTTSYTYDENGLRLSKTTGGVTTKIYRTNGQMVGMNSSDGKDLMFLLDGSGNVYGLHYDHYSSETQTAAATYYFAYNAQGDVIGIYDASGTVVATYAYDEWGNCTVQVLAADSNGHAADSPDHIAQVNPFRYRGYFYDNETGLYYLNSRYYDPETCRFLNADKYVQTGQSMLDKNMFVYCMNNPVAMVDTTGDFPWAVIVIIACAVIGGVIGALADENLYDKAMPASNNSNDNLIPSNNPILSNNSANGISNKDNSLAHNNTSSLSNTRTNNSSNQTTDTNNSSFNQKPQLSTTDRLKNIFIGATLGLGIGGAIVATGGAVMTVFPSVAIAGTTGVQVFAIGALAFNLEAMVFAPFYNVEIDPIEWSSD